MLLHLHFLKPNGITKYKFTIEADEVMKVLPLMGEFHKCGNRSNLNLTNTIVASDLPTMVIQFLLIFQEIHTKFL